MESSTVTQASDRGRSVDAPTIAEAFRRTVESVPDRVAVRTKDDEVSLTWGQLRDRADALAGGLARLGVTRGDTGGDHALQPPRVPRRRHRGDAARHHPFSIYQTYTPEQIAYLLDGRPYNTALIVLDADFAPAWAKMNDVEGETIDELAGDEKIAAALDEAVDAANGKLSRVEQIKRFHIVQGDWAPGGDELTPTMKLKRKPIAEKYAKQIEALYAE